MSVAKPDYLGLEKFLIIQPPAILNSQHHTPACPHLSNLIHSVWQVEGFTPFRNEVIIPKGIIELIFNFSDSAAMPALAGGKSCYVSRCFINGFNTTPLYVQLPERQQYFGVQLQPTAVKKILQTPASLFADTIIDLVLVDAGFESLWQQLAGQSGYP